MFDIFGTQLQGNTLGFGLVANCLSRLEDSFAFSWVNLGLTTLEVDHRPLDNFDKVSVSFSCVSSAFTMHEMDRRPPDNFNKVSVAFS